MTATYARGCHPVLVVDPDDRDQAEAFAKQYNDTTRDTASPMGNRSLDQQNNITNDVQATFRAMLAPRPPSLPSRPDSAPWLRTTKGHRWVRLDLFMRPVAFPQRIGERARPATPYEWDNINAVRVLSEGVPS